MLIEFNDRGRTVYRPYSDIDKIVIRQVKGIMKCIRRYMDEDTRKRVIAFVETSENAKFRRAWADTDPERKKRVCC